MKRIFFSLILLGVLSGCAHAPLGGNRPPRQTLVIALDGIPYPLIRELKEEGRFAGFQPPAKVISPFPSTTTCGFGAMFRSIGADVPQGYDREYYSRERKSTVSFFESLSPKSPTDFRNFFDYYRRTPTQKFWIYAAPGASGRRDLEKIRRLVWRQPDQEVYLTYIGGTDGIGHVLGRKRAKRWLTFLDGVLTKMRRDYREAFGRDLDVVLFSDHGFHYVRKPNAVSKIDIVQRLRRMGLTLSNNLKRPSRVVAIEWGNISGANFYADPAYVPRIAEVLAQTRGVDIVAYPWNDTIRVLAYRPPVGEYAEISCRPGRARCRYEALSGDPLHYQSVVDRLRDRGLMDRSGFAASQDWFEETKDGEFPDALYRLHHAFDGLVQNPASILLSTHTDYEYGDVLTRIGAWMHGGLKGTHGGLFQEASAAFVMATDLRTGSSALRYDQVLPRILKPSGPLSRPPSRNP